MTVSTVAHVLCMKYWAWFALIEEINAWIHTVRLTFVWVEGSVCGGGYTHILLKRKEVYLIFVLDALIQTYVCLCDPIVSGIKVEKQREVSEAAASGTCRVKGETGLPVGLGGKHMLY